MSDKTDRKICEAATPGPWHLWSDDCDYVRDSTGYIFRFYDVSFEDRDFIIHFNPSKVVELLDRIDELESELERVKRENEELRQYTYAYFENQNAILARENLKLKKRVEELERDRDRIDWIDRWMDCDLAGPGLHVSRVDIEDEQTLRQAIDEAMSKTKESR